MDKDIPQLDGIENLRHRARVADATHVVIQRGNEYVIQCVDTCQADDLRNGEWVKVIQPRGLRGGAA